MSSAFEQSSLLARAACIAVLLAPTPACERDREQAAAGHNHGHAGEEDSRPAEAVTRWGTSTQLFVEFPALVVGQDSPFAAHLTRLQDHAAVDHGRVIVELKGGGQPAESFSAEGPSVPGIFRPIVTPTHAGTREVIVRIDGGDASSSETHELGQFTVYPTVASAAAAASEDQAEEGISYLLEQQWKVAFGVERVETRELRPSVPAFARLGAPSDAAAIITSPHAGRVDQHDGQFALVGDEVEAGGVLFELITAPDDQGDPASLDLAVEQAKIRVDAAQRELDRVTPLVDQGALATRRLNEAHTTLSAAEAELRSARRRRHSFGQSQTVGGHGDHLHIPSPITGTVAELQIAPGAWISAGQALGRVVDRHRLWLDVGVPEAHIGELGHISGAWFRIDGVDAVFELPSTALVSIGVEVNPSTRTLPVRFAVDNAGRELFAGMTTWAHLIVDTPHSATAVPASALIDDNGTDVVYVQLGGESFARRIVRLGIHDGDYVEVLDGVSPGEWVVSRGAHFVKLASTSTESIGHGHAH